MNVYKLPERKDVYTPPRTQEGRWPLWTVGMMFGISSAVIYIPILWVLWAYLKG